MKKLFPFFHLFIFLNIWGSLHAEELKSHHEAWQLQEKDKKQVKKLFRKNLKVNKNCLEGT